MQKKNHCCLHCNKNFHGHKLHQQICKQNGNRNEYHRYCGVDADAHDGGFKLIESAFKKVLHVNALKLHDMESVFSRDVKNLLQREVVKRKGIKWSLALKAIMYKSVDPDVVTDPPIVFNTDMVVGLMGSNYEDDLKAAFENVMQKLMNMIGMVQGGCWISFWNLICASLLTHHGYGMLLKMKMTMMKKMRKVGSC